MELEGLSRYPQAARREDEEERARRSREPTLLGDHKSGCCLNWLMVRRVSEANYQPGSCFNRNNASSKPPTTLYRHLARGPPRSRLAQWP
jgi:hypothetical protein